MSIDAIIEAVTVIAPSHCTTCLGTGKDPDSTWDDCPMCHGATKDNPRVRLKLGPRESGGLAGQPVLTMLDPPTTNPEQLGALVGIAIWGNSEYIMVGNTKWARRIGYTKIRLLA
jgi:hypothetical protein